MNVKNSPNLKLTVSAALALSSMTFSAAMKYKTLPRTQTKEERKKEYSRATAVEMEMSKSLNASFILSDN